MSIFKKYSLTPLEKLQKGKITYEEYRNKQIVDIASGAFSYIDPRRRSILETIEDKRTLKEEIESYLETLEIPEFSKGLQEIGLDLIMHTINKRKEENQMEIFMSIAVMCLCAKNLETAIASGCSNGKNLTYKYTDLTANQRLMDEIYNNKDIQRAALKKMNWEQFDKELLDQNECRIVALLMTQFAQAAEKRCAETGLPWEKVFTDMDHYEELECFDDECRLISVQTKTCLEPLVVQCKYADKELENKILAIAGEQK